MIILFRHPEHLYAWTMSPVLQPMAVQYYCHMPPSVSRDQYSVLPLERVLVM